MNLIFVFTKIKDIINIKTGKKHAEIYMKYSKYIGAIFKVADNEICKSKPINHKNSKKNNTINTLCNWFFFLTLTKNIIIPAIINKGINNNNISKAEVILSPP